jgi:hypothetical protein
VSFRTYFSPRDLDDIGAPIMPIRKVAQVRAANEAEGPTVNLRDPQRASDEDLRRTHATEQVQAMVTSETRARAQSQRNPCSTPLVNPGRTTRGRIGLADGGVGCATPKVDHGGQSVTVSPPKHPTAAAA